MKCADCGFENRIDRLYCEGCGAPLEHDLSDVQAAVDQEIRTETARSTSRGVRWILALGIVMVFVGYSFRSAYKDLPENDVVAFATAPSTRVNDRITITTDKFGVPLPQPRSIRPTALRPEQLTPDAQLRSSAYRRAAVLLKRTGTRDALEGFLVGDLVIQATLPGQKLPVQIHIADVRHLRPTVPGVWEVRAVNVPEAVKVAIPGHRSLKLQFLEPQADSEPRLHDILLSSVQLVEPVAK